MKRTPLLIGLVLLCVGWIFAAAGIGITGHMIAHMASVAIAAPLIAYAVVDTPGDAARRWPGVVGPVQMSVVELFVVWGWHLPAARAFASSSIMGLAFEQAMFLAAGLLLWSACLGTRDTGSAARRMAGVGALLLTTMHMTLLGTLITLAPRPLFGTTGFLCFGTRISPLADQQLGGVVMLLVGAGSYLLGGLFLLSRAVYDNPKAPPWS